MNEERLIKVGKVSYFYTLSDCHYLDCQLRQDRASRSVSILLLHSRVRS